MNIDSLHKLYVHQLKDLFSAENQILDNLPRMIDAADDDELETLFREHENETRKQIARLETIFEGLDFEAGGHKCKGAEGLLAEAAGMLEHDAHPAVRDAGLIASAQRIEHYEMAGYGCARAYAAKLGFQDAVELLQESLDEEAAADLALNRLAERRINFLAMDI